MLKGGFHMRVQKRSPVIGEARAGHRLAVTKLAGRATPRVRSVAGWLARQKRDVYICSLTTNAAIGAPSENPGPSRTGHCLRTPGAGVFGALACPGRTTHPPTHPPTHIRKS